MRTPNKSWLTIISSRWSEFKRQKFRVSSLMPQMNLNKVFRSFTLGLAHEKFDV